MKTLQYVPGLLMAVLLSGCVPIILAGAAGAGGVVLYQDRVEEVVTGSVDAVFKAASKAVEKDRLSLRVKKCDGYAGLIEGDFADKKRFSVTIQRLDAKQSKLIIRIFPFFQKERAQMLLGKIKEEL